MLGLPAPFACPGCEAREDFVRKGRPTRLRRFDTAAGRVEVRLWNVGCRHCTKVFAPLLVMLDLTQRRRADCNPAIGLQSRSGPRSRRRAHSVLLGLTVGEGWSAMDSHLSGLAPPRVVVVDGEEAVTKVAERVWPDVPQQRCWWHLCRGFRWALYADKAPSSWANDKRAELLGLLRDAIGWERSAEEALVIYDAFVDTVHHPGHHRAVSLLEVARSPVFTCLDPGLRRHLTYLSGPELGSGVIERTMRDILPRVDIGGSRWTIAGLRDVISVLAARRFRHPAWDAVTRSLRPPSTINFRVAKFNAGQ